MPTDPRERFLHLLKNDVLKLDLADLDFGIYRVLAHRREEIRRFFDEDLPAQISQALAAGGADRTRQLDERLSTLRDELTQQAQGLGLASAFGSDGDLVEALRAFPKGKTYVELAAERKTMEAGAGFVDTEEAQIFAHLYTFFSRYYRDGDFLPQPRRGRKAQFSVPYQGEDVHFSWRGRGNHYVKTAEELSHYAFRFPTENPAVRVRFELVRAEEEENNVKGKARYFLPLIDRVRTEEAGEDGLPEYVIPFEFRPFDAKEEKHFKKIKEDKEEDAGSLQQAAIDEVFQRLLEAAPAALGARGGADALQKHLKRYVRKSRTDYFVHPDLGRFLRDELDYFLKTEVVDVAALTAGETGTETLADRLTKLRVVKQIADDVIALLDQVEDVQARLFEKRKLVLRADYLVPMFAVPEALHAEIIGNKKQRKTWAELFGVGLGDKDVEELKRRPTLVVDTAHFRNPKTGANPFQDRLLASFDDLEAALGGVLVHSENYGALRTLGPVYDGRVKCIYLDPPYNTGSDDFLYKDDFARHSTWLTMMEERLRSGRDLLSEDGALFVQIGDEERANLEIALNAIFGIDNYRNALIVGRGIKSVQAQFDRIKALSTGHDSVYFYSKRAPSTYRKALQRLQEQQPGKWDTFWRGTDRPTMRYELFGVKPESGVSVQRRRAAA